MQGKTVLITGATSGMGKATALTLAGMGARIVFTARDIAKGVRTCEEIIRKSGNHEIYPMFCRLDSLKSVSDFCTEFLQKFRELHVLINNAGILETQRKVSEDGIELTFAVNHLAPFLMTNLLIERLSVSAPARIINVSSDAQFKAVIDFDDIELNKGFPWMKAYRQSKLANVLFTYSLAKKLEDRKITVNCLHPGFVNTPIFRNTNPWLRPLILLRSVSPRKGAQTIIYLASSPEVEKVTGSYFVRKNKAESANSTYDQNLADRLWTLSLEYVKNIYVPPQIQ